MYVSVRTRPDIAYSVSKLARYFTNFDRSHWKAAKQIAKYLNSTKDYAITYGKERSNDVKGYCDADWAGDLESRKSTSGILFTIGGTAFLWKSKLQSIVASSTMEAEYISMVICTREALRIRKLLNDFNLPIPEDGISIFGDNKMALTLAKTGKRTPKSKHIDVCYQLTIDYVSKQMITYTHMPGKKIPADRLTKALEKNKSKNFVEQIDLKNS